MGATPDEPVLEPRRLMHLPDPVQRYLAKSPGDGQRPIRTVRCRAEARFVPRCNALDAPFGYPPASALATPRPSRGGTYVNSAVPSESPLVPPLAPEGVTLRPGNPSALRTRHFAVAEARPPDTRLLRPQA
jgi:hypothetical protein